MRISDIRILAGGKERKAQRIPGPQMRQRQTRRAMRRAQSGLIAVERQDRFGRGAPQKLQLVFGERGAERCDGGLETRAHQRDHVHIAFGDDDRAGS